MSKGSSSVHPWRLSSFMSVFLIGFTPFPFRRFFPLSGKIVNEPLPGGQSTSLIALCKLARVKFHSFDRAYSPAEIRVTSWTIFTANSLIRKRLCSWRSSLKTELGQNQELELYRETRLDLAVFLPFQTWKQRIVAGKVFGPVQLVSCQQICEPELVIGGIDRTSL